MDTLLLKHLRHSESFAQDQRDASVSAAVMPDTWLDPQVPRWKERTGSHKLPSWAPQAS